MPLNLEQLESRLAPSTSIRFTDVDGDRVTITSDRGDFGSFKDIAEFEPVGAGRQLKVLYLSLGGFQGATVTTAVTPARGGDGLVNIGRIEAAGVDLASVTIKGDLGTIKAGDADPATRALGLLKVRSMGLYGLATQGGTGDLRSTFNGALGALKVAGDVREATIDVIASSGETGRLGPVTIGGSLIGGAGDQTGCLFAQHGMGLVTIGGDVVGGGGITSGVINCTTNMAGVTIGGSLVGGPGLTSGAIFSDLGAIGPVKVGGDIAGGSATNSGRLFGRTGIASLTIGGSLVGGTASDTGKVHSDSAIGPVRIGGNILGTQTFLSRTGRIEAARLASVTVGGSVVGGRGVFSGSIETSGSLGPIRIGGALVGGPGGGSGIVRSGGALGPVRIGGALVGGSGDASGEILAGASLGPVRIGGDVLGGSGGRSGQIGSLGTLASVTVGGSVVGGAGRSTGSIAANGDIGPVRIGGGVIGGSDFGSGRIATDGNLASVTVGGSVVGGSGGTTGYIHSFRDMGPVTVGGDLAAGSSFGGFVESGGDLASVTIGGSVLGGPASESGMVLCDGTLGPVRIGRDLRGGSIAGSQSTLDQSGYIQGDHIASVWIGGSIVSGTDTSTAGELTKNASIRAADDLGPVVVKGSLVGNTNPLGYSPVVISARGQAVVPAGATTDLAIKSLTVGGRVELALVLAGYSPDSITAGSNGNASIGAVGVGRDWVASSLAAGVWDADLNGFGTAGDAVINNTGDAILARIASVTIGGAVAGTAADPSDHFGFVAQRIGSFRTAGFVAPLTAGTDVIELSPTTGDVTIREV